MPCHGGGLIVNDTGAGAGSAGSGVPSISPPETPNSRSWNPSPISISCTAVVLGAVAFGRAVGLR